MTVMIADVQLDEAQDVASLASPSTPCNRSSSLPSSVGHNRQSNDFDIDVYVDILPNRDESLSLEPSKLKASPMPTTEDSFSEDERVKESEVKHNVESQDDLENFCEDEETKEVMESPDQEVESEDDNVLRLMAEAAFQDGRARQSVTIPDSPTHRSSRAQSTPRPKRRLSSATNTPIRSPMKRVRMQRFETPLRVTRNTISALRFRRLVSAVPRSWLRVIREPPNTPYNTRDPVATSQPQIVKSSPHTPQVSLQRQPHASTQVPVRRTHTFSCIINEHNALADAP